MTDDRRATATYDPTIVRMVSASLGSILTALVVTPLDVVKVRQQAANSAPSTNTALGACSRCGLFILNNGLICGETVLAKLKSPHFSGCVTQPPPARSLGAIAAAVVACPAGCGCTPLPPTSAAAATTASGNVAAQAAAYSSARSSFPSSTLAGLRHIYGREGVAGIYAGLTPTLVMAVPATVLYFTAYDHLKLRFEHSSSIFSPALAPALAGMAARVLASAATSPLELVRTLMQSEAGSSLSAATATASAAGPVGPGLHHTTMGSFRAIVASGGVAALWRGLEPTLWRDVPFSAAYWLLLERARAAWRQRDEEQLRRRDTTAPSGSGSAGTVALAAWAKDFASGAGAGMLAASVTTPMDVAKTRRQVYAAVAAVDEHGASSSSNSVEGALAGNGSTPRVLRAIWQAEGAAGLFRGHTARLLKISPACAIMISSYEAGKRAFGLVA